MRITRDNIIEFLLTYGWAILVLLAAIGALFYFGVLGPNAIIQKYCYFDNDIECYYEVEATKFTEMVDILLTNKAEKDIKVSQIIGYTDRYGCVINIETVNELIWEQDTNLNFKFENCNLPKEREAFGSDVNLMIVSESGKEIFSTSGSIQGMVR